MTIFPKFGPQADLGWLGSLRTGLHRGLQMFKKLKSQ